MYGGREGGQQGRWGGAVSQVALLLIDCFEMFATFWKSRYIEITKFKTEAATHIALNLLMNEEQTSLEEKFILALYLVRKKVLIVRKEKLENFSYILLILLSKITYYIEYLQI